MGPLELVTLVVLAVLLFGPDKLPEVIHNAAGFLRRLREFSESAKEEVRSELGSEFKDFEFEDLHPKTFVRKHVLDGDSFGFDEFRSALDPRKELDEVVDVVRGAPDEVEREAVVRPRVNMEKGAASGSGTRVPFDPDAT